MIVSRNITFLLNFQYLNANLISWGSDFTLKFDWIDGNWNSSSEMAQINRQKRYS